MDIKEIRDQTEEELEARLEDIDKTIFALRNELKMSRKLEKPHLLKDNKKFKAQVLTILSEKQNKHEA